MMRPSNELPAVYLCRDVVDFRKGINGLAVLVEEALQHDPFSEQLFVFCNRKRDKIKMLYWERSGFCLWQKRLERARFNGKASSARFDSDTSAKRRTADDAIRRAADAWVRGVYEKLEAIRREQLS